MDLREEIIKAAIRRFASTGLKFTMQDIAAEMHIAKKTIYRFFVSKEELLLGMLEYGFEEIQKEKMKILESDMPLAEKVRSVMIALPEQYTLLDFRQLEGIDEKYPAVADALRRHLETDWEPVIQLLKEGQKEGIFRKINVPVLRIMISSGIEAFVSGGRLKEEGIAYDEALNHMMNIIMKGILK